jgi:hypothetical protein
VFKIIEIRRLRKISNKYLADIYIKFKDSVYKYTAEFQDLWEFVKICIKKEISIPTEKQEFIIKQN